jgi:hypothetical protein
VCVCVCSEKENKIVIVSPSEGLQEAGEIKKMLDNGKYQQPIYI